MKHILSIIVLFIALNSWANKIALNGNIAPELTNTQISIKTAEGTTLNIPIDQTTHKYSTSYEISSPCVIYLHTIATSPSKKELQSLTPLFIPRNTTSLTINIILTTDEILIDGINPNSLALANYSQETLPQLLNPNRFSLLTFNKITTIADSIAATLSDKDASDCLQFYGHLNRSIITRQLQNTFRRNNQQLPSGALIGYKSAKELISHPGLKFFHNETAPLIIDEIAIGATLESRLNRVKEVITDTTLTAIIERQLIEQDLIDSYSRVGGEMPYVPIIDINGNEHYLNEFKGKYVYLDIWASWCGPCNQEIPYLKDLEKTLDNDQVVFVAISIDEEPDSWKAAVQRHELKGNQFLGNAILANYLKIEGIPRYLIYDKEGRLLYPNAPRPSSGIQIKRILKNLK